MIAALFRKEQWYCKDEKIAEKDVNVITMPKETIWLLTFIREWLSRKQKGVQIVEFNTIEN